LDVAHSNVNLAFIAKDLTNLSLKAVEILYLGVNLVRGFVSHVLDEEWFNLFECVASHESCSKGHLTVVRKVVTLESEVQVELE
jgi:hypothetical protein